nr:PREDICTED: uncharacterized protein LOC109575990 [Bos indicus]
MASTPSFHREQRIGLDPNGPSSRAESVGAYPHLVPPLLATESRASNSHSRDKATWAAAGATGSHRKGRPWKALNPATSAPPGIRFQHPTDGPRAPLQLLHRRPPVQRGWPTGCSDHHPNPALLVVSPDHQLHLMENLPPVVPGHPAPPAIHMRGPGI